MQRLVPRPTPSLNGGASLWAGLGGIRVVAIREQIRGRLLWGCVEWLARDGLGVLLLALPAIVHIRGGVS